MELDTFIESHKEVRWEFLRAADPINKESEWLIALTATACSFYWLEFLSRLRLKEDCDEQTDSRQHASANSRQ
jgi:hypothetical protein